jgi:hypothetical protein
MVKPEQLVNVLGTTGAMHTTAVNKNWLAVRQKPKPRGRMLRRNMVLQCIQPADRLTSTWHAIEEDRLVPRAGAARVTLGSHVVQEDAV